MHAWAGGLGDLFPEQKSRSQLFAFFPAALGCQCPMFPSCQQLRATPFALEPTSSVSCHRVYPGS